MICAPHPIAKDEKDGECSTHGGEQKCILGFGEET